MPRMTPAEKASKTLAQVDQRITDLTARRDEQKQRVEDKYAERLAELQKEREHAAAHPALTGAAQELPAEGSPADA